MLLHITHSIIQNNSTEVHEMILFLYAFFFYQIALSDLPIIYFLLSLSSFFGGGGESEG